MASDSLIYPAGTMFRYYNTDRTAHHTAIMLKDGFVLEIKNPHDRCSRNKFHSLSEYEDLRGFSKDMCEIDLKNAVGVPIDSNTNGFNYPTIEGVHNRWQRWLYSILVEGAPHLLNNGELREAYNEFVEACEEAKSILSFRMFNNNKFDRYRVDYLKSTSSYEYEKWQGLCGSFGYFSFSRNNEYSQDRLDSMREAIVAAYKKIYAIVEKDVTAFLTKMNKRATIQQKIRINKRMAGVVKRRIQKLESQLTYWNEYVERNQKQVAEYEAQLAAIGY